MNDWRDIVRRRVVGESSGWPEPRWSDGVPWCSESDCQLYDGKRCYGTGSRPHGMCEPVVAEMAKLLDEAKP